MFISYLLLSFQDVCSSFRIFVQNSHFEDLWLKIYQKEAKTTRNGIPDRYQGGPCRALFRTRMHGHKTLWVCYLGKNAGSIG